jgi:hypothetical protein
MNEEGRMLIGAQSDDVQKVFPALLTAVNPGTGSFAGQYVYDWNEQVQTGSSGEYTQMPGGRSGTGASTAFNQPATELNNNLVNVPGSGLLVWMRFKGLVQTTLGNQPAYEFTYTPATSFISIVNTTIALPITAGAATVTPAKMDGITIGCDLWIDGDFANSEAVSVTAVTSTTFTAAFANAHPGNMISVVGYPLLTNAGFGTHAWPGAIYSADDLGRYTFQGNCLVASRLPTPFFQTIDPQPGWLYIGVQSGTYSLSAFVAGAPTLPLFNLNMQPVPISYAAVANTTLTQNVAAGTSTVKVASPQGIVAGGGLLIGTVGVGNGQEFVTVTATSRTAGGVLSFTAVFASSHNSGETVYGVPTGSTSTDKLYGYIFQGGLAGQSPSTGFLGNCQIQSVDNSNPYIITATNPVGLLRGKAYPISPGAGLGAISPVNALPVAYVPRNDVVTDLLALFGGAASGLSGALMGGGPAVPGGCTFQIAGVGKSIVDFKIFGTYINTMAPVGATTAIATINFKFSYSQGNGTTANTIISVPVQITNGASTGFFIVDGRLQLFGGSVGAQGEVRIGESFSSLGGVFSWNANAVASAGGFSPLLDLIFDVLTSISYSTSPGGGTVTGSVTLSVSNSSARLTQSF